MTLNGHARPAETGYNTLAGRDKLTILPVAKLMKNPRGRVKQLTDWLGQLGLGQCAELFAENDIYSAILATLTVVLDRSNREFDRS